MPVGSARGQRAVDEGEVLFRTFAGLGFLDVHVEMTVDPAHDVTARVTVLGVGDVGLPVQPGSVLGAVFFDDISAFSADG